MIWKIEVADKPGVFDAVGAGVAHDARDLGIRGIRRVRFSRLYWLEGELGDAGVERIARELLVDPVTQIFFILKGNPEALTPVLEERPAPAAKRSSANHTIEIAFNPGVMDPWEESVTRGIGDLGISGLARVRTGKKFAIEGDLADDEVRLLGEKLLYNKLIQHRVRPGEKPQAAPPEYRFKRLEVGLLKASDRELLKVSEQGTLSLDLAEMKAIQTHFRALKRNPTDCELETIAQTWSEHCKHKTFRSPVRYRHVERDAAGNFSERTIEFQDLLKDTIFRATQEIKAPWCVSVFQDNSGVIRFDETRNVCFKVETHNHPSALEPYGGAATGLGGVIRDVLGTGLSAKPFLNTDVFAFGPQETAFEDLPKGTLHPKRVMKGVVAGVRDYGNRMGIPTANGAILFDEGYTANPLVFCGSVGLLPKGKSFKSVKLGDLVVAAGGRTGRDGIHGATFSSIRLTEISEQISSGAVQIGNAITEKRLLDVILQARDRNLFRAITDCGAGGLSSAVGELASETGAVVELSKVPLKYQGLSYTEIWISESQERMVMAVPQSMWKELSELFAAEDVEATAIGEFTDDRRLRLLYDGVGVLNLSMDFLHDGLPRRKRQALFQAPKLSEPVFSCPKDLTSPLLSILKSPNVASKEWVIRQYDHEVQGGSVVKPLLGPGSGPSDAAVARPVYGSKRAVAVACGINPLYGRIDPYWMAASAIDEAIRQIVSVGGDPSRIALLDNFCWGNTNDPEILGRLVRASLGCYETAKGYATPFISGKDSLHNEYAHAGQIVSIPDTLLISAIGILEDAARAVTMDAKSPGNGLYVVGPTFAELGGSHYYKLRGESGARVPRVFPSSSRVVFQTLAQAIQKGWVRACHDCSEGGIGVALAEMLFAGHLGAQADLRAVALGEVIERDDFILFSESNSRFVVEVDRKKATAFERHFKGIPCRKIGELTRAPRLVIRGLKGGPVVKTNWKELRSAWQSGLSS